MPYRPTLVIYRKTLSPGRFAVITATETETGETYRVSTDTWAPAFLGLGAGFRAGQQVAHGSDLDAAIADYDARLRVA